MYVTAAQNTLPFHIDFISLRTERPLLREWRNPMNHNLPVPVERPTMPYIKEKKRYRKNSMLARFILVFLALAMVVILILCVDKLLPNGLFGSLRGLFGGGKGETTTAETTTGEETTGLYDFDYGKISEGAFGIVPCDLGIRTQGVLYENLTDLITENIVPKPLDSVGKDKVTVLVINTHPYEAYTDGVMSEYSDASYVNSGDAEHSVVKAAQAFIDALAAKGIQAVYVPVDTTQSRNSYTTAYEALTAALKEYPDVAYIVDIHRDILLDEEDSSMLRPVIAGEEGTPLAQMRLVVGTDADGASYPDWKDGYARTTVLAEKIMAQQPSLLMPTRISGSRLNQHLPCTVFTAEIGTCGNSTEEAVRTATIFGMIFADAILKK